ncbi:class I SAM-dependent methyltransferase [Zhihengliuella alba]|uniref:Class I SAM-dependent methyltransferase n=1 Tax=Zhihengliuella alba TaxID=547018 RepID=A0ABP7D3S1_9MICC
MSDQPAPVPNLPRRAPRIRAEIGEAFTDGADHYDAVRPAYPAGAVDFLLGSGADVLDVGAGTGILTAQLLERGASVTALDPSADMLRALAAKLPGVRCVEAPAEATGLEEAAFDVVVCAQAWHWVDPERATAEAVRVLRPGGALALVWNQLDVTVPWVHRLARIMHAGDVHRPEFEPEKGPGLGPWRAHHERWREPVTPEFLGELAKSRAYYLRATEATRATVRANLDWYLYEHLGHAPGERIELPYYTHAWRADRG